MKMFQKQSRLQLDREVIYCWKQGKIAVSKNILPETFLAEVDQIATCEGVGVETAIKDGVCYAMANNGLPLGLDINSEAGQTYCRVSPLYRINMQAWMRLNRGLER